jgi:hypothetical protein
MQFHSLAGSAFWKAVAAGAITAVLTVGISLVLINTGISPFPAPPSLVFAGLFFASPLLPVGFLFHFAYVLAFSLVFVSLFREKMTIWNALLLGAVLWLVSLVVFFPAIGWGFFGLAQSPQFIVAALVPHVLFAIFLWGSCKFLFRNDKPAQPQPAQEAPPQGTGASEGQGAQSTQQTWDQESQEGGQGRY